MTYRASVLFEVLRTNDLADIGITTVASSNANSALARKYEQISMRIHKTLILATSEVREVREV